MNNNIIRKGRVDDAEDFARLFILSCPALSVSLFGTNAREVIKRIFLRPKNLFSLEHSCFAEVDGRITGMVLGYNWEHTKAEWLRTYVLLFKYMKWSFLPRAVYLLKSYKEWNIKENEYYVCSFAVYPEFRGRGSGTKLLLGIEQEARKTSGKAVLDVDVDNSRAIKLYERFGYVIESPASSMKTFEYYRMNKTLK